MSTTKKFMLGTLFIVTSAWITGPSLAVEAGSPKGPASSSSPTTEASTAHTANGTVNGKSTKGIKIIKPKPVQMLPSAQGDQGLSAYPGGPQEGSGMAPKNN
jgi:hypothetical protein